MNISDSDYNTISEIIDNLSYFEDEEINDLFQEDSSVILASSNSEIKNCDSVYNFIAKILTHGYNICYNCGEVLGCDLDEEI